MTMPFQIREVRYQKEYVDRLPNYNHFCLGGHKVFYYKLDKALIPGHIYSKQGAREFRFSQLCEFCYDEVTKDNNDES